MSDGARSAAVPVIGWAEFVDFPDWGIARVRAKVDSGARTSALHVDNIVDLGRGKVSFDVVLHRQKHDRRKNVVAHVLRESRVKCSNGTCETRYVVQTTMRMGPVERKIELSLAQRGEMVFRMLIGRAALENECTVDVSRRYLVTEQKRKRG